MESNLTPIRFIQLTRQLAARRMWKAHKDYGNVWTPKSFNSILQILAPEVRDQYRAFYFERMPEGIKEAHQKMQNAGLCALPRPENRREIQKEIKGLTETAEGIFRDIRQGYYTYEQAESASDAAEEYLNIAAILRNALRMIDGKEVLHDPKNFTWMVRRIREMERELAEKFPHMW